MTLEESQSILQLVPGSGKGQNMEQPMLFISMSYA